MREVKLNINEDINKKRTIRFYLRCLFHLISCSVFLSVQSYGGYLWFLLINEEYTDQNIITVKWYTPCYLTNWNFLFQTIFLTVSLVYDVLEWMDRHDTSWGKKIKFCRDVMFSGVVVPLTLFISSMFWTIFWIDRELVFPEVFDQLVPWWFNHCVHTNITIVVLLETILVSRRYPAHFKLELMLNGTVGVLYAIVYYSIYFFANRWLYGVFGIMTWWQICLYQLLIWGSTYIFYFIQFPINRIFHKEETADKVEVKESNGIQNGSPEPRNGGSWLKQRSKSEMENSRF